MERLKRININPSGDIPIPLESVARITIEEGPSEIRRVNQQRSALVMANIVDRDLFSVSSDVYTALRSMDLPSDFTFEITGQNKEMEVSLGSLRLALLLAIFMVYIVMASQFESFLHPFVILFTIPLALIGVAIVLFVLGIPLNIMVFLGLIMLAGIVVNNAIVLVDYINQLRRKGLSKVEAIKQGGQARLRPILMTTATTVLGLLPMALGLGDGAEIRTPMAITVIAGLISSTILTLVIIPTVYALFIAVKQIAIELLPTGFSAPYLCVWVPYRNANPQEIEEQIARPVEEEIRTIAGVKKVESYSHTDGCWIGLEFVQGTDMDFAYDQLRDRMERARALLPDDIDRYFLRKFGRNDEPIIFLSISIPETMEDPYYVVEHYIKRPIERIDGVANIEIWGAFEKVIQILVDQDKVDAYGINLFQTISQLRRDNFAISSGWVSEAEKKFTVRSLGRFQNIDEIRKIPINDKGLTLDDVAEVRYDVPERNWFQRVNRKPSIKLGIFKESLANTVDLSHKLKDMLQNEISKYPALKGAEVNILFVQGDLIEESINNLIDTALWGGLFALLVIFFFLRRIRITLIMTLAIPLSILISLTITYFIGWTLNTVTMMGLMVSVGMVVDNAIVVLENIYRKRNEGMAPR
ncbi:MAG: efflux RND transporter permease subunit, partial [Calditrichia bacterium]